MNQSLHSATFENLTNEELYQILRLRSQIFVVEQNCIFLDMDNFDQQALHLFIKSKDSEILAYCRIFNHDVYFKGYTSIGRVVTKKEYRATGIGKKIVKYGLEELEANFGKHPVKIGAQCYLKKFYEDFGFKIEGDAYLEDGILHNYMVKT